MAVLIHVAPNAFKGTLSPLRAAEAIRAGIEAAAVEAKTALCPVSDGGDGLIEVAVRSLEGETKVAKVSGPLGGTVKAKWALLPDQTAVIEMAEAAGLALVPKTARDPLRATTRGVGGLLCVAAAAGATRVILGLGGSATVDGGAGMAQALGVRLLDKNDQEVEPGGGALERVARIDASGLDARVRIMTIDVACDVTNPLLGARGAAAVFGPQKGASPKDVAQLESGLARLEERFARDLGCEVSDLPGAGAAGGLGAGLAAFLDAQLRPGAELVLDLLDFDAHLAQANLVITGEGCLDSQTAFGKAPAEVAKRARQAGVPCVALAGAIEPGVDAAALGLAGAWGANLFGEPVPENPAGALQALAQAKAKEMLALARKD